MFGMTLAGEMDRYGVTVNVICPSGLTRMTEDLSADFGSDEQQALKEKQATAHRTNESWAAARTTLRRSSPGSAPPTAATSRTRQSCLNTIRSDPGTGQDGGRSAFSKRSSLSM